MRNPVMTMAGHLMWSRSGTVWATWRLVGSPYGFAADDAKTEVRRLHQMLLRAHHGEALLLGLRSAVDPASVIERMIDGVNLQACPDWAAECEAALDLLDSVEMSSRTFWLAVPLANDGRTRISEPIRSALGSLKDALAMPRGGVPADVLTARLAQAQRIEQTLPSTFEPRRATVAEQIWIQLHAQQRGLPDEVAPPERGDDLAEQLLTPRRGAGIPDVITDEGARGDLDKGEHRSVDPRKRCFLKLDSGLPEASYQAMVVLTDVPSEGMAFPGSEFLGRVDEAGPYVDWAVRLNIRSRDEVLARNRKAVRNLNDQYQQREAEASTGANELDIASSTLADYQTALASDELEVEVEATVIFAVAATTADQVEESAASFTQHYAGVGYSVPRPIGHQTALWWAMLPGVPTSRVVKDYSQIATSRGFSASCPLISSDLGDRTGELFGFEISGAAPSPVLLDVKGASTVKNMSGSIAFCGEMGAGKALALNTPIPTPRGWALMGNLTPGDMVFDESGRPTPVVAISEVMSDRPCFKVSFSDGSHIVADADHLWTTLPGRVREAAAKANYKARQRGTTAEQVDLDSHNRELVADGWPTRHGQTHTTSELAATLLTHGQANHAIPIAKPLQLPQVDLPIDPYYLGAWLGDGTSRNSHLCTADAAVLTMVEAAGYTVTRLASKFGYAIALPSEPTGFDEVRPCAHCATPTRCRYRARLYCSRRCAGLARRAGAAPSERSSCEVCKQTLPSSSTGVRCADCFQRSNLTGRLRLLGVIRNKHIPTLYLRSHESQRRALLAGLLDTDGTVAPNGAVQFDNTNPRLAMDVLELVRSLGYRPALRQGVATLDGRHIGPKWTVSWTTTDPVFALPRKLAALTERTSSSVAVRNALRYVTAVDPVPSVPVRCIKVATPSHLYLAGQAMVPTHNSVGLKALASSVADRGGQWIAIDRSESREWVTMARALPRYAIVDILLPEYSCDPLRLFGPIAGARVAQSFLIPLCNATPTSTLGLLLSDVLDAEYLQQHQLTSLGALLRHLREDCELPGANDLVRLMNVYARKDLGRVIFDETLPSMPLEAAAIVFATQGLELPEGEQLTQQHLFDQLSLEARFGRAMYAFIAAIGRHVAFADPRRLVMFLVDECHHVTATKEGEKELIPFIREGRKAGAALGLGSQDAGSDFGSATLRGLIPYRVLMRHQDPDLAARGLEWLGLNPEDPTLLHLVTKDTSPVGESGTPVERRGEGLMRDGRGRHGRVKVLMPARAARAAAMNTTPQDETSEAGQ